MTTDSLRNQARREELNEEWGSALALYQQLLERSEDAGEPEIALYNRVADLQVRLGDVDGALVHYDRAVDLYVEAGLPNNAIAICRKILRNVPGRAETFLRMGRIRAHQGFGVEARRNVLTYVEMMESKGNHDAATSALEELVTLFPSDAEARVLLGERLVTRDRAEEGIESLLSAWKMMTREGHEEVDVVKARILDLDPVAVFPDPDEEEDVVVGVEDVTDSPFYDPWDADRATDVPSRSAGEVVEVGTDDETGADHDDADDDDRGGWAAREEEAYEGRSMTWGEVELGASEDEVAVPLPSLDDAPFSPPSAGDAVTIDQAATADPDPILLRRSLVERLQEAGDRERLPGALLGLADALTNAGDTVEARAIHEQVLQLDPRNVQALEALGRPDPAAASSGFSGAPVESAPTEGEGGGRAFVDLGALILDDEEDEPKTTRWKVDDERSGDEDADFADMLSKFKAKVALHITRDDARASYDLGAAYREMGLIDEAIGMFQQALRSEPGHLASLEVLGQCFLDRDEPHVAIRVLDRALQVGSPVEDDLLGIYYYLGIANEKAGNRDEAREFYEKVFSIDINFMDVTERLRALR